MEQETEKQVSNGSGNENKGKIEQKFNNSIRKLAAIVQGESNLKPVKKLPQNEVSNIVTELFKEDREAKYVEVKTKLKELLRSYHEMEKALKQKREELEKLANQKKEEFVKAANSLFDQIEGVDDIQKSYYSGLSAAIGTPVQQVDTESPAEDS